MAVVELEVELEVRFQGFNLTTFQVRPHPFVADATSERSFSALKRIKSYLRSTMSQSRLNHLMLLYYHQDLTDQLNMQEVANDFICAREQRNTVVASIT